MQGVTFTSSPKRRKLLTAQFETTVRDESSTASVPSYIEIEDQQLLQQKRDPRADCTDIVPDLQQQFRPLTVSEYVTKTIDTAAKRRLVSKDYDSDDNRSSSSADDDSVRDSDFNPGNVSVSDSDEDDANVSSTPKKVRKRDRSQAGKIARAVSKNPFRNIVCGCNRKCNELVANDRRQFIHEQFWCLSYDDRRKFLFTHIQRRSKIASTVSSSSRRDFSYSYMLDNNEGQLVQVCKVYFLTTLGYHPKNDSAVIALMKATATAAIQPVPDQRGKHPPANKIERTMIEQHIETFNPQISHYRREHAPLRRYLPSDVTVTGMH